MARNKRNREDYTSPELKVENVTEPVINEVTDGQNQLNCESSNQESEKSPKVRIDAQTGFVQALDEDSEPDMEVTVTTAEVKEDGSVELSDEPIELEALEGSEIMPPMPPGFSEFIATVKSMSEPKELRKADPAVVAKSKENQAKKHVADNPFGKKVKPEIYKVKHNKNDERLTDNDLIGNVVLL